MDDPLTIIRRGKTLLRDPKKEDIDYFIRWQTSGEWREFDAPWERIFNSLTDRQKVKLRGQYHEKFSAEQPLVRVRALIVYEETPIGWVNRYGNPGFNKIWNIGIDICEDQFLNQGLGTTALELWRDYLFSTSEIHKLGLQTWSLNPRMIRVAEKLRFRLEGIDRELILWGGKWINRYRYGLLKSEWESIQRMD